MDRQKIYRLVIILYPGGATLRRLVKAIFLIIKYPPIITMNSETNASEYVTRIPTGIAGNTPSLFHSPDRAA
jgi:hypothetical protein